MRSSAPLLDRFLRFPRSVARPLGLWLSGAWLLWRSTTLAEDSPVVFRLFLFIVSSMHAVLHSFIQSSLIHSITQSYSCHIHIRCPRVRVKDGRWRSALGARSAHGRSPLGPFQCLPALARECSGSRPLRSWAVWHSPSGAPSHRRSACSFASGHHLSTSALSR